MRRSCAADELRLLLFPTKMRARSSLLIPSSVIFAVSFACYWSSLDGGFVFDDHRGVLTNDDLDSSKTSVWELFQHDFWGGLMSRKESHKSYRPLTVLTYRYLNFEWSGLEPYSYHLVNVLLHCTSSVLVMLLCGCILGSSSFQVGVGLRVDWSTYAALLFAVHSIHTEAVASVVGRAEILSCIFFLLSIVSYIRGVSQGRGCTLTPLPHTNWRWVIASLFLALCAMLSKEQGIVAIGVSAAFDVFIHWEEFWQAVFHCLKMAPKGNKKRINGHEISKDTTSDSIVINGSNIGGVVEECSSSISDGTLKQANFKKDHSADKVLRTVSGLARRLVVLVVSGIALMWFRLSMNYNTRPIFKEEELRAVFHPNRTVRMLSFSNLYAINAWLLLSPSSLCCDWTLGSIPLVTTLTDPRNSWSLALYATIMVLAAHVLRSKKDRTTLGFGLALLLLSFLPASGLVFRVGFVIAERVLYMPSVGLCLMVATGARRLVHSLRNKLLKTLVHCFLASLVIVMAVKTHERNKDWATDFKLFESGVRVNPMNVKLRNNYGIELKSAGRDQEAMHHYKQSLAIDPEFGEVYLNMGNLLSDEKNYAEALAYFEKAVEFPQMYHKTLNNLATTYFRLGQLEEAEVRFRESIQMNPDQPMTYNNLASLYGEQKRYKESEKTFRKALKLNPQYTEAYFNLGTLFIQMGELDKGEKYLKKALQLQPDHPGALNNLRVIEHYRKTKGR